MSRLIIEGLRTVCGGPFSFSVERGECVVLSGPSGCGKTLLLRALADLDPAEGTVQLDGTDRNEIPAPDWRRQVGWLPAEASWWFDLVGDHFPRLGNNHTFEGVIIPELGKKQQTPTQLVPMPGSVDATSSSRFFGRADATDSGKRDEDVASTLEKLGFEEDVLNWRIERLSTGEKQRLALFRLLLNEPKVLLLDEPTAALDVSNVWNVEEVLSNVRKTTGAAVVWVSHDPTQIERVADRHLKLWGDA